MIELLTSLGGQHQAAQFIFMIEVFTSLRGQRPAAQSVSVTGVFTSLRKQMYVRFVTTQVLTHWIFFMQSDFFSHFPKFS